MICKAAEGDIRTHEAYPPSGFKLNFASSKPSMVLDKNRKISNATPHTFAKITGKARARFSSNIEESVRCQEAT